MNHPATYAKGILAGLIAFVGAGATAAVDNGITYGEWWVMAGAGLAALGGTYGIPNRDPKVQAQDQSVQPPTTYALGDDYIGRHRDDSADTDGRGGYQTGQ
jgi:hypothetical protein